MAQNVIPEKLINYSVYQDGSKYLGVADVTLPTITAMSDSFSGAGIAGEIDSPTIGHYSAMSVSMTWRLVTPEAVGLMSPGVKQLDFRMAQQSYDRTGASVSSAGLKVSIRAIPKSFDLGTLNAGQTTGTTNELEVIYIKITDQSNKVLVEIDKMNFKAVFNGVDALKSVRTQLGMN